MIEMPLTVEIRPRNVKEMVVHANDARDDGVPVEVKHRCVFGRHYIGAFLDRGDLAALDNDIPIFKYRSTGPVDDARMAENGFRCSNASRTARPFSRDVGPGRLRMSREAAGQRLAGERLTASKSSARQGIVPQEPASLAIVYTNGP